MERLVELNRRVRFVPCEKFDLFNRDGVTVACPDVEPEPSERALVADDAREGNRVRVAFAVRNNRKRAMLVGVEVAEASGDDVDLAGNGFFVFHRNADRREFVGVHVEAVPADVRVVRASCLECQRSVLEFDVSDSVCLVGHPEFEACFFFYFGKSREVLTQNVRLVVVAAVAVDVQVGCRVAVRGGIERAVGELDERVGSIFEVYASFGA